MVPYGCNNPSSINNGIFPSGFRVPFKKKKPKYNNGRDSSRQRHFVMIDNAIVLFFSYSSLTKYSNQNILRQVAGRTQWGS